MGRHDVAEGLRVGDDPGHIFVAKHRPSKELAVRDRTSPAHLIVCGDLVPENVGGCWVPILQRLFHDARPIKSDSFSFSFHLYTVSRFGSTSGSGRDVCGFERSAARSIFKRAWSSSAPASVARMRAHLRPFDAHWVRRSAVRHGPRGTPLPARRGR